MSAESATKGRTPVYVNVYDMVSKRMQVYAIQLCFNLK